MLTFRIIARKPPAPSGGVATRITPPLDKRSRELATHGEMNLPVSLAAVPSWLPRARLVDVETPPIEIMIVEAPNGIVTTRFHLNKAKTTGASGLTVRDDIDGTHRSVLSKQSAQLIFRRAIGQVSDINLLRHTMNIPLLACVQKTFMQGPVTPSLDRRKAAYLAASWKHLELS